MPETLEPFVPTAADPWDAAKAGHLLRRTGFGPLPDEVAAAVAAGPERATASLFAFPSEPAPPPMFAEIRAPEQALQSQLELLRAQHRRITLKDYPELRALYQAVGRAHGRGIVALTAWWLDRMASSPAPLQEKLALFWHGHFTSSFADVHDAIAMFNQNQLFRRHAAGSVARLLDGVARDPAMLHYLNNNDNRKGHPNENWARELMELFTMGIGHYTEADIKESARAWTGWSVVGGSPEERRTFTFHAPQHDGGPKAFLGQTGAWDGTDVMRIILAHPATPRWIALKLAQFFVSPQPDPRLVDAMARLLRAGGYDLAPVLLGLFRSRAFYRRDVMLAQVKSPVEFTVGAVRHLGIAAPDWMRLSQAMAGMGQRLFFPPTVAGWHGGTSWMNAATVFARTDVAAALLQGRLGAPDMAVLSPPEAAAARLLGRPLAARYRAVLTEAPGGSPQVAAHLVMSLPEYQVA